jgi:EAL domain-containing protein (putative c-di-GMP-specific phosphodiesterase class I)
VLFDREMHRQVTERLQMETDLFHAVERNELLLNYQPVVSLSDGKLSGFEALVRWRHPTRGIVPPSKFIPCGEETSVIGQIGFWVLREACSQFKKWQDTCPNCQNLSISVNLSAKQLSIPELAVSVQKVLDETGISPQSLILEITETAIIRNTEMSVRVLQDIKKMGIRLYMDDFGTGYSSLSCLHQFPLTGLKIDQNFVKRAGESRDYAAIVQAIVVLARNLGMSLVAEGIETPEQLALLLAMECDKGQGYYFARPMDAAAAGEYIRREGNSVLGVRKAG